MPADRKRGWRTYLAGCSGNLVVGFALALVPLVMAAGGAVDINAVYGTRAKVQTSLDTAVLAAVTQASARQADVAAQTFAANLSSDVSFYSQSLSFDTSKAGTLVGSAQVLVPLSFLKIAGVNTMAVGVTSTAMLAQPDTSCILTLGQGLGSGTASMTFNGAPSINLTGCGLRSNTSMSCNGHNGSAIASLAVGSAAGCSNPASAAAVPDLYKDMAANISLQCGGVTTGGTWTPTSKPTGNALVTVTRTGYTEFHVCGPLALSGSGTLSGLSTTSDSVIVVENGGVDVGSGASIVAPRTAIVLAGANTASHVITSPQGKGKAATLALTPPTSSGNPWAAVAIYLDPAITANADMSWGPGATLTADGLIYLPKSNVTMSGNGNSNNGKCTKFVTSTFTTNGNVNLNFSQSGCSASGLKQWAGAPVLSH